LAVALQYKSGFEEWNPRMNWFTNHAFGSQAAEWLALGVVILLALELCIGTLRFVYSLLTHERNEDESEKNYWRAHGGE
jgi:hypothetical protein